jgi:hypothetical protein
MVAQPGASKTSQLPRAWRDFHVSWLGDAQAHWKPFADAHTLPIYNSGGHGNLQFAGSDEDTAALLAERWPLACA